jgi:hypothetical protein
VQIYLTPHLSRPLLKATQKHCQHQNPILLDHERPSQQPYKRKNLLTLAWMGAKLYQDDLLDSIER